MQHKWDNSDLCAASLTLKSRPFCLWCHSPDPHHLESQHTEDGVRDLVWVDRVVPGTHSKGQWSGNEATKYVMLFWGFRW